MPSPIEEVIAAIRAGETDALAARLAADPALATATLPDNDRSPLHHATDWPGHWPNVARSIALLVEAGADPNQGWQHPNNPAVAETPLHWAASSGDVEAVDALLDAGAEVDALGGIFDGCPPYPEAVIFEKYEAARRLLERGAQNYLPGAAALGMFSEVKGYFDEHGEVRLDIGMLRHWPEPPPRQVLLDRAFQFACRAGHLEIARFLHERGADPTSPMPGDTDALAEARSNEHTDVVAWLESLS